MRGTLITFEGVDGGGKSKQSTMLASALRQRGLDVILTREPGGSDIGEHLRKLVTSSDHKLHKLTELFLFMADRSEHVSEVIIPALERGAIVICDRYIRSTEVYQGVVKQAATMDVVTMLNNIATQGRKPDIEILIDCPVPTIIRRMDRRGEKSKFDKMSVDFHQSIRDGYLSIAAREKHLFVVDGDKDPDRVFIKIWQMVNDCQQFKNLAFYEGV